MVPPGVAPQSTQPCSAHVPHGDATLHRSGSRVRWSRTDALFAVIPASVADSPTEKPAASMRRIVFRLQRLGELTDAATQAGSSKSRAGGNEPEHVAPLVIARIK